jgi:general secretion pathway protein K
MRRPLPPRQAGAALLSALLIVTLVASLSAAALWQQWRLTEVERHERGRQQADWILHGAVDWARLILREDARSGGADHLGEPWAVPLQEARLSSFLASDRNASGLSDLNDVFLAGRIEDMQGRLNLSNLVADGKLSEPDIAMTERLFALIDLPVPLARQMASSLRQAMASSQAAGQRDRPFLPQRVEQLVWLGLSEAQVDRLAPHVSLLPQRTTLNLNTASAELISASLKDLSLGQARKALEGRHRNHWADLSQAKAALGGRTGLSADRHGLSSRYFRITGHIRQDDLLLSQQALVRRDGLEIRTVWRHSQTQPGAAERPP